MATPLIQQFLQDPDQPGRRAELIAFLGPNPEGFLAVYDRMFAIANRPSPQKSKIAIAVWPWIGGGFCAPAFFLGFVWFYYRKMWGWATGFVAIMVLLEWVPATSQIGLVLAILMALVGRRIYLGHAIETIHRLRAQTRPEQDLSLFLLRLRNAGGVSRAAGWISGSLFVLITVVFLLQEL